MKHTKKYMDAKWVIENPEKYDDRDVARANSFIEAYNEGYNKALSLGGDVERREQLVCDCVKCKPFHNESAGYRQHKFCVKNKAN